jgi:hypothetical protein
MNESTGQSMSLSDEVRIGWERIGWDLMDE